MTITIVLFCLVASALASLSLNRVRFIDAFRGANHTNYLFRGNLPVKNKQFQYAELISAMRTKAMEEANITLPTNVYLIDFNLLNLVEFLDSDVEKKFFKANPTLGEFVSWPIIGNVLGPDFYPHWMMKDLAKELSHWQIDNLPKTMSTLRGILETQHSQSTVIYVHCEAGEDRTGEVSGSYYMRYLNWTFHAALAYDDHVETRLIEPMSRNALQWYCEYLKYVPKTQTDCTVPHNETITALAAPATLLAKETAHILSNAPILERSRVQAAVLSLKSFEKKGK